MTFDNMKAQRVARLGWFSYFHVELHTHQDIRVYLVAKMNALNLELDFEICLQYVWCRSLDNRAITKALIFDVDAKQWNRALAFFVNFNFNQHYKSVRFIPLRQRKNMEKHVMGNF